MNENDGYEDHGDTARSLFARLAADTTAPTLGFTGDSLVRAARSRQRTVRAAALIGATTSVAAIAVAVPLTLGGGSGPGKDRSVSPGTVTNSKATATTTPSVTGPATTAPSATGGGPTRPQARRTAAPKTDLTPPEALNSPLSSADAQRASASFRRMIKAVDPTGGHLSFDETSMAENINMTEAGPVGDVAVGGTWWGEGPPRQMIDPGDPTPYLTVQMTLTTQTDVDQLGSWGGIVQNGVALQWQHRDSKRLPDGTTVKWAWNTTPAGSEMVVQRILGDGRQILISMRDGSVADPGQVNLAKPTDPFPFTAQQLIAAVSDPGLTPPVFH